jgi:uncharacterized membrane protein
MSYSLLSLSSGTKSSAMSGLRDAAVKETERENNNDQLKAAEKQQTMSSTATGAMAGAYAGAQSGSAVGPWGAAIGAVAGYAVGELF